MSLANSREFAPPGAALARYALVALLAAAAITALLLLGMERLGVRQERSPDTLYRLQEIRSLTLPPVPPVQPVPAVLPPPPAPPPEEALPPLPVAVAIPTAPAALELPAPALGPLPALVVPPIAATNFALPTAAGALAAGSAGAATVGGGPGGVLGGLPGAAVGAAPAAPAPIAEEDVDQPPEVTHKTLPEYPTAARRRGLEGWVDVVFTVDTRGQVGELTIADSSSPLFHAAVRQAVPEWTFKPGRLQGSVVPVRCRTRLYFRLQ